IVLDAKQWIGRKQRWQVRVAAAALRSDRRRENRHGGRSRLELAQEVAGTTHAPEPVLYRRRNRVGRDAPGALRDEVRHQLLMEREPVEDRVELLEERAELSEQRRRA